MGAAVFGCLGKPREQSPHRKVPNSGNRALIGTRLKPKEAGISSIFNAKLRTFQGNCLIELGLVLIGLPQHACVVREYPVVGILFSAFVQGISSSRDPVFCICPLATRLLMRAGLWPTCCPGLTSPSPPLGMRNQIHLEASQALPSRPQLTGGRV